MSEKKNFSLTPVILLGAAFAFAFYHLWHTLIPFALSFAAAYLLTPLVNQCQLRGLRRSIGVVAIYALAGAAVVLLANTLIQIAVMELHGLKTEGPAYAAKLKVFMIGLQAQAALRLPFGVEIVKQFNAHALSPLTDKAENIPSYLLGFVPLLEFVFLVPFITFFLLLDGPRSIEGLIQTCPSRLVEQALHLISEIDTSLGNYVRGLVLVDCYVATAGFIGLVILGVHQALWIALVAGMMSFLPILGAAVGIVVGGLVAWIQFGSFTAFLQVFATFGVIHIVNETILQPLIAKHSVHLHPLLFLLTFLIGGEFFGFAGLIFAVPAVCVLKALIKVAWLWYSTETQSPGSDVFDLAQLPYT